MHVLVGRFEIHVPWSHSLKEKRMVVRSIRGRVREKFEVACSEVAHLDLHQRIVMAIAAVGPDRVPLEQLFEKLVSFVDGNTDGELIGHEAEILEFAEDAIPPGAEIGGGADEDARSVHYDFEEGTDLPEDEDGK